MRKPVLVVMSALSAVVLVAGVHAGAKTLLPSLAQSQPLSGAVVLPAGASPNAATTPRAKLSRASAKAASPRTSRPSSPLQRGRQQPSPAGSSTSSSDPATTDPATATQTPTQQPTQTPVQNPTGPSTPTPTRTPSPTAAPTPTKTTSQATAVNGGTAQTRYGPVQVQITVQNHQIVSASAPQYPSGSGRDQQINSYAIPQLNQETVNAQSASIDMVSGATYTSQGYIQSLQSAIDAAKGAGLL